MLAVIGLISLLLVALVVTSKALDRDYETRIDNLDREYFERLREQEKEKWYSER